MTVAGETFRILRGRNVIFEEEGPEVSKDSVLTAEIEESGGEEGRFNAVRVLRRDMATIGLINWRGDDR